MKHLVSVLATLVMFCSTATHSASIDSAKSLYSEGELSSALQEVNQLLKVQQTNPEALFLKAQLQYKKGEKGKAIATYQSIIKQYPQQLEAYNNLAAIYAQYDNLQAASEVLEQAMHVNPVYATIYDNLRAVYWDMSRRHVRAALKQQPEKGGPDLVEFSTPAPDIKAATNSQAIKSVLAMPTSPSESTAEIEQEKLPLLATTATVETAKVHIKPKSTFSDEQEIISAITNWAKEWSNRDAAKYVDFYTASYHPTGKTHKAWAAGKRWNFKTRKFIKVSVDQLNIRKLGDTYITKFLQSYHSDLYKDKVVKELKLNKQNGLWKISQETTIKAL